MSESEVTVLTAADTVAPIDFYSAPPDGVRVNMVNTLDNEAAFDGRVAAISDPTDHQLLLDLRAFADVLLVGAGTVRAESYGRVILTERQIRLRQANLGSTGPPPVAVVTTQGRLPRESRLFGVEPRPLIITTAVVAQGEPDDAHETIVAGHDQVDLPQAIDALRERGFRRILCEGGPSLLQALAEHDLIDEMCVTVSPMIAGGQGGSPRSKTTLGGPRRMKLAHVLSHNDFLYLRYIR
ncbi:riboflavin biosynthesis pyrimidine reductase [Williamsia muralis]|uniref:Riboflavin biosynthesis pyrimidine reductase n=1 Tax=Williamsia marianensis TaxID=85044 RepID=A0A495JX79_WILMA|nr:pyrimidine reductase family protein [Williamsia muralis]RKR93461.1 riboflavin biosynthesis pyrimidine reductase [Williamsia muralis]